MGRTGRSERLETDGSDPYANSLGQHLRWYLSVSDSTVADATTGGEEPAVWVTLDGDPYPGVVNTTGSALIDGRGVVREVHRSTTTRTDSA